MLIYTFFPAKNLTKTPGSFWKQEGKNCLCHWMLRWVLCELMEGPFYCDDKPERTGYFFLFIIVICILLHFFSSRHMLFASAALHNCLRLTADAKVFIKIRKGGLGEGGRGVGFFSSRFVYFHICNLNDSFRGRSQIQSLWVRRGV